jgi:hypothetical protein
MKKEHIVVCLLTYADKVNVSFIWWIDQLRSLNGDEKHPRTYEVMYVPGLRPVSFARNVAITNFLTQTNGDKLWFIDDDLVPTENSIKIFDSKADIVSGLYWLLLMKEGVPTLSTAIYKKIKGGFDQINPKERLIGQHIIPIDSAGTGTLLISRKVLEDQKMMNSKKYISAEGDEVELTKDEALPIFRTLNKSNGAEERSEDIDFVWRAKQLGYKCECVLDARFYHKKEVLIDWLVGY